MQGLIELGILLVFFGFMIVFLGVIYEAFRNRGEKEGEERKTEAGGIILIGPIPIIFGSSKKIEKWMVIIALIIVIIMVLFYAIQFI
ncbi:MULTISPECIES: TIGR00304 family protein [Acidianus]|uniref:TIGR00304 family protein n=1 Tax=Candidatus Acidianus copahuensis TaxID=1160895 RepID=A0A031LKK9_9CREN|nr:MULTISPECIES: TIGR00304 family protein [Acidianus]EZQ02091.1 hypothetical protein CM19_11550 [Candidatus Acidianus copahuensis]NON63560.1 TIGR00304 family protein [Acidianus sp. RZ1]